MFSFNNLKSGPVFYCNIVSLFDLYWLQIRRRVKQVPLAFYKSTPNTLFSDSDFPGWSFKINFEEHNSADALIEEQDNSSMKRQRVE